jgi:hypothetical protein
MKIADIGCFNNPPPLVTALLAGEIAALDSALASGWDIEAAIALGQSIQETPLTLALAGNASATVRWLVEHKADLNRPDEPAFPIAARYADPETMRYLVQHGADVHARRGIDDDAYQEALYGEKLEHLPVIEALGHSVAEHGGAAFRSAVFDRNAPAAAFFLAHGVNVDFRDKDQVFPDGATPLLAAARNGDVDMCRSLVAHGADVKMANRDGERPYTVAVEQGDDELAAYFKSLEPPEWHSTVNKLHELEPYKLSTELLEFLQGEQRRIELPDCDFGFVEFFALTDTIPLKAGRRKVLRISRITGDYSDVILVWNPKTRSVGYWDIEHEEYADVASFKDFMSNPTMHMDRILSGDCQE